MKIIKTANFVKQAAQWGRAGSGILFICPQDGSAMLLMRSGSVEDPNMWGIPGGAVKGTEGFYHGDGQGAAQGAFDNEQLWNSAQHETSEEVYGPDHEVGFPKVFKRHPEPVIYDTNPSNPNSFKFYTFIVEIPLVEKQRMLQAWDQWKNDPDQWENTEMQWFPISQLRGHISSGMPYKRPHRFDGGDLHHGVAYALDKHPYFARKPKQAAGPWQLHIRS